jgi:hypothetical protein
MEEIARIYSRFSTVEAKGRSPLYEELTRSIAEDERVLGLIGELPPPKRQPNLLLAGYRSLCGTPSDWNGFRSRLIEDWPQLSRRILHRSTQTNEPARCATLLGILAQLPGPLALIEVGAAAGLCLLPDEYAYDFNGHRLVPEHGSDNIPVFRCSLTGPAPIPDRLPEVAWRAGLDLEPVDLDDHDRTLWLEHLIWPGQEERLSNFRAAAAIARKARPRVVKGNLLSDLERLCSEAPGDCTKVIFHSAVLAYVGSQSEREHFATSAMELGDFWISNESPSVFPKISSKAQGDTRGRFLLSLNGQPLAWTDPHGTQAEWLAPAGTL